MYGYIYLTTNLVNGKKYIGQHKGSFDSCYIGTGIALARAIKKYGKANFNCEPLYYCETKEDLDQKEIEIIDLYDAVKSNEFYNQVRGGRGGILYERRDGEHNPFYGKAQTEKQKQAVSKSLKGRPRPQSVIDKWSETQRGKKLTQDHKDKLTKPVILIDTFTNEELSFKSNNEAIIYCKCSNPTYYLAKRKNTLLKKRYKFKEEI